MDDKDKIVAPESSGAADAMQMVEDAETGGRQVEGVMRWVIFTLAVSWSLFQLSIASWLTLDSSISRAIHLVFALTLTFLVFPMRKRGSRRPPLFTWFLLAAGALAIGITLVDFWRDFAELARAENISTLARVWGAIGEGKVEALAFAMAAGILLLIVVGIALSAIFRRSNIPWFDYTFALAAAGSVLYLVMNYEAIALRGGAITPIETVLCGIFLTVLLEGTRRSLGPALAIIGFIFLLYALIGQRGMIGPRGVWPELFYNMPEMFQHRGYDLKRLASQMYITSEGVFGIALGVSTQFVFLFVLFGAMLDRAGAGKYFIDVANSMLGGLRGGPAKASVVASGMTGMVSGSSLANVVTTGTFTIPLMKRTGYPDYKAAATEVAVSTNGQIMPPVMGAAAFLIAEYVGIKYFDVVRAAVLPALVSYIALFYIVHLEALKLGLKGIPRSELPPRWLTFISGVHYILPLGTLIYFLVVARVSPGFAVMYAIVMLAGIMFIQEPIRAIIRKEPLGPAVLRGLWSIIQGLESGARNMVGIAVAVATAGIVVGVVNLTGLGLSLTEIIQTLGGYIANVLMYIVNPVVNLMGSSPEVAANVTLFSCVLFLTAIASLILGLGLPTTANYIVMATLTAPIIVKVGTDLGIFDPLTGVNYVLAAHMFVFFFGILADDTPPVGLAAYAAAAIAKSDPIRTGVQGFSYDIRTAILPFMFIFNTKLLLEGVHTWGEGIYLFVTALIGMFAFGAGTQGYALRPLNVLQRLLLIIVAFMLIQPQLLTDIIGFVALAATYVWQWLRIRQEGDSDPAISSA